MKTLNRVLWGIVLVVFGVLLSLKILNVISFDIFFRGWWTLIIIIPCVIGLFTSRDKTGNIIGIIIGGALLLACQNIISFGMLWKLLIPIVIILIGIRLIFGDLLSGKKSRTVRKKLKNKKEGFKSYASVFSSQNLKFDGELFVGAEINAIFGSVTLDLRNAIIADDCVVDVTAIFGGVDILLPENVDALVNSNAFFGGITNKKAKMKNSDATLVYVNGNCMFGGVDIK